MILLAVRRACYVTVEETLQSMSTLMGSRQCGKLVSVPDGTSSCTRLMEWIVGALVRRHTT
jgi:hypothetical protein